MIVDYETLTNEIIARICECGFKAYLTGGAVRDLFAGNDPHDFDVVTDATPKILQTIFPDRKVKTVGANFLVTLIDSIEVATYRSDSNFGSGRHNCIAKACETLEEDLSRRDFTFNALAICPYTGEVVDPFNGRSDLYNKVVQFVGDANQRIYEDELRMIRAARFACLIEGQLSKETFDAIRNNRELIKNVSNERIRMELIKVMTYKRPSIFFDILRDVGILEIILPELDSMYNHPGGNHHGETLDQHFKMTGDNLPSKYPLLRLVGYFHDIGKPEAFRIHGDGSFIDHDEIGADMIEKLLRRLKFTNEEVDTGKNLVLLHMRHFPETPKSARKLLKLFTDLNINFNDFFRLKVADKKSNLLATPYSLGMLKNVLSVVRNKSVEDAALKITDLEIDGNDVMRILNIPPGRRVGEVLKMLLDVVIEDPSQNDKKLLEEVVMGL